MKCILFCLVKLFSLLLHACCSNGLLKNIHVLKISDSNYKSLIQIIVKINFNPYILALILEDLQQPYWIDMGSLLGAYRCQVRSSLFFMIIIKSINRGRLHELFDSFTHHAGFPWVRNRLHLLRSGKSNIDQAK